MANGENRDFADDVIDMLEPEISEKYNISLKLLVTDPLSIENKDDAANKIADIKGDVENYLDKLSAQSAEKPDELIKTLGNINDISIKLENAIITNAHEKQIPILNATLSRARKKDEVINIENFDENVMLLVNKLLATSLFAINESYTYKEYKIGSWIFSSAKNYSLQVFLAAHELMIIDYAKTELENMLEQASSILSKA